MRRKVAVVLALFITVIFSACGSAAGPVKTKEVPETSKGTANLRVFAAASLYGAFTRISSQFEAKHPGVKVELNFAGSQQLANQINEGAPADIFASADQQQMNVVIQNGLVVKDSEQVFAGNRLVVVIPKTNPGKIQDLKDLARAGLRLVLAAKEVPVGRYSLDFLNKASQDPQYGSGFQDAVLKNVASYENSVKSVLNKVSLGEADAGIVYQSDLVDGQPQVQSIPIPNGLNVPASYMIAPVNGSQNHDTARAFIEYVLSEEGQSVLVRFGFIAVR